MHTCLFIDATPIIRKIAVRILLDHDLHVDTVESIADAMGHIEQEGYPDILIVSSNSASGEIETFVRELKSHPNSRNTVVLASIVEANLGLMTRLKRAGVQGFVMKPFDRKSLAASLLPFLPPVTAN